MSFVKDKKLFGKINFIDILLVLIFAIVALIAYKILMGSSATISSKYVETTCIIRLENLPMGTHLYINEGDEIYDNETKAYIGKVVSYEVEDYEKVTENLQDGEYTISFVPGKERIFLKLSVEVGDFDSDLITENNYYIKVGKEIFMRGPCYAGSGYITFIDRLE